MKVLALIDPCCAQGYSSRDLGGRGMGGTEATVLRVAEQLKDRFRFNMFQANRPKIEQDSFGQLLPLPMLATARLQAHHAIIVINSWKVACKLRRMAPDARIILWLHVFPGRHNRKMGPALARSGIEILCVSASHAMQLREFLAEGSDTVPHIGHIYNPIPDDLAPDGTPIDPDLLLFASSPHKGLREVFARFRDLRQACPSLRLEVADPGYLAWDTGPVPDGVDFLGSLDHGALIARMRPALCLFYPQTSFRESFGLVIAEANAVGTPAILHRGLGANDEIASPEQCIDCTRPDQIAARLDSLRRSRPQIRSQRAFRLSAVADSWADLLTRTAAETQSGSDAPTIHAEIAHAG